MSRCLGVHLQHLIPSEKINLTRDQIFIFSRCEKNRQNDVVKKTAETKLHLLGLGSHDFANSHYFSSDTKLKFEYADIWRPAE